MATSNDGNSIPKTVTSFPTTIAVENDDVILNVSLNADDVVRDYNTGTTYTVGNVGTITKTVKLAVEDGDLLLCKCEEEEEIS